MVNVGDTVSVIQEGVNANVWTVGVIIGSSEMGLSLDEFNPLSEEEQEAAITKTEQTFIDSGADFTIVPLANLQPLNIPILRPATLSSQWPDRRAVNVYEVDLRIGSLFLPAIEVAGDLHSNEIILGCNVLNYLIFI